MVMIFMNKNNLILTYLLMILILLTLIFINNFFILWMIMEFSSLIFISLMCFKNYKKNSILYFLISSFSSIFLMISFLYIFINFYNLNVMFFMKVMILSQFMFFFSVLMKIGLFPFHFWTNIMMKNIDYMIMYIFLTFLKLIPLMMIYYFYQINNFIMLFILMSIIVTPFFLINQFSMKLMLLYSSMFHSSIMMYLILLNPKFWIIYFFMYSILLLLIIYMLYKLKFNNIYDMMNNYKNFKFYKLILNILIIFYCQFPPFSMFIVKFSMVENMSLSILNFWIEIIIIIIMLFSLFSTFNYLNYLNYNFMDLNFKSSILTMNKFYTKKINMMFFIFLVLMSLFLPMMF